MTTMVSVEATPSDFTEVASGTARAFLQLQTYGTVVVAIAKTKPASTSRVGLILTSGEVEEVSFDQLETGDKVFVRSLSDDTESLVVAYSDAAP